MFDFYKYCGIVVIFIFLLCILIYIIQCILELIVSKRYKRLCMLDRIHNLESDLSCFRVEFENTIENLEELIENQNKLIKHHLKLISKKIKD